MKINQIIDEWFERMKNHTKGKTLAMISQEDIQQLKKEITYNEQNKS